MKRWSFVGTWEHLKGATVPMGITVTSGMLLYILDQESVVLLIGSKLLWGLFIAIIFTCQHVAVSPAVFICIFHFVFRIKEGIYAFLHFYYYQLLDSAY